MHIVIDGYNLIGALSAMGASVRDIEAERENLIERLKSYKRLRGARITVVFDGTAGYGLGRTKENKGGIEVIFSRAGETADTVLKEYAGKMREGLTLITSDRDVASFAEKCGAVVVSSGEFVERLESAEYTELKGVEEDEGSAQQPKKGQARRPPKKERLKMRRLKKL
ncbi:MAG: NYN domain-containing protein [Deltaproteobacteria bacterium]|nr:NYN domain-containing protein [Deltaproteobacteria bacterium]